METEEDQESAPSDCEGWRDIIAEGGLDFLPPERIVAAVQALGPEADERVLGPLLNYLADKITRLLHRHVGKSKPNRKEIISRAHFALLEDILQPDTADGVGLRTAFGARVFYRAIDAIRKEDKLPAREPSYEQFDTLRREPRVEQIHWTREGQEAYVEEVLMTIPDPKKRFAFRLHMEGVPAKSKKGFSISDALRISDKTAMKWIAEVQELLKCTLGEKP